ncbi:MAG: alpha/beta hydrolase [Acidimicrobiia bacterium]|nr:alpha/beta hydrolase [Acidimicrobiia bacterium]
MTTGTRTMPDGTELYTKSWDHPNPTATILIIHGVSEHVGRWDHVAQFFLDNGFEVHSYDQRAHGESGDGTLDIEDFNLYVDDIAHTIADIRTAGRPLVLYGHSMGGLISTSYAQSGHPQPDVLVLSAPALVAAAPPLLKMAAKVMGRIAPKFAIKSPVEKSHLSRDPAVGEAYVNDPKVYLRGTARFGKMFFEKMDQARAAIGKIGIPTLVIHGAEDEIVPPRASAPLAGVAGVQRRVFPGLRHEMHNEPEQDEVLGFVAEWVKARL